MENPKPKIRSGASIDVKVSILLTETEARALHAITLYGEKEFTKVFYEKLGKAYLKDYEEGINSLFTTIRMELSPHLKRADAARAAFEGQPNG